MRTILLTPTFCLLTAFASLHADSYIPTDTAKTGYVYYSKVQYASYYTKEQVSLSPGATIPFDQHNVEPTKGISYYDGDFYIKEPGVYRVTYSISLERAGAEVALTLNGHVVPGSEVYIGENNQLTTASLLVNICGEHCCDYVLRLVNNNPPSTVWTSCDFDLQSGADGITASLLIEKVDACDHWGCGCGGAK